MEVGWRATGWWWTFFNRGWSLHPQSLLKLPPSILLQLTVMLTKLTIITITITITIAMMTTMTPRSIITMVTHTCILIASRLNLWRLRRFTSPPPFFQISIRFCCLQPFVVVISHNECPQTLPNFATEMLLQEPEEKPLEPLAKALLQVCARVCVLLMLSCMT
jgi:hypothetical protein